MEAVQIIGRKARHLRDRRGLTAQQVAVKAGLALSTVNKLEAGRHWPRVQTLQAVAAVLEVPVSTLLESSEEEPMRLQPAPLAA